MQNMDWIAAMERRRSVRSYEPRPVEEGTLQNLKDFAQNLQVPFTHDVTVRFFKTDPGKRLYGAMRVTPPDGMAFIAPKGILSESAEGFIGQMMILYATSYGISTCWFESYSREEAGALLPGVSQTGDTILLCALGYFKSEGLRLYDRAAGTLMSGNRRALSASLEGTVKVDDLPAWLLTALGWARKAPSAINSQPWRFAVSSDYKEIRIAKPPEHLSRWGHADLDIGICACQFYLALLAQGLDFTLSLFEESGRAVWQFIMK